MKANSSNFPKAPDRRTNIPRAKEITDTVGLAMKDKVATTAANMGVPMSQAKKNATITEDDDESYDEDFDV